MSDTELDELTIVNLQNAVRMNLCVDHDEGGVPLDPDFKLLDALLVSLQFFMPPSEYSVWYVTVVEPQLKELHRIFSYSG